MNARRSQVARESAERGSIAVETAITMLLFLILLFAVMEAGRFINVQQTVTYAAHEAARFSVAPQDGLGDLPGVQEIENEALRFLTAAGIRTADVRVERPLWIQTGNIQTEFTRVTVTVPYRIITLSMFRNLQVTLSGVGLMRNETSPE